MYICSILHSIYSICSSRHTFKSWIWTSEKSCTSCSNWGVGGGGNLDKIQKNSSFFRESVPYLGCSRELSLNKSIEISDSWESLHWKRSCFHSYHLRQWILLQNFWDIYIVVYMQSKIRFWNKVAFFCISCQDGHCSGKNGAMFNCCLFCPQRNILA